LASKFDQIMVIPSGDPYMRINKAVASPKERLAMCEDALGDLTDELQEKVVVLDIEVTRKGPTYTYDTLQSLKAFFPKDEFTLIIGSDAAASFDKWKRASDLRKMADILVVKRPGDIKSEFKEVEIKALDISSTKVREELAKGSSSSLSKSVMGYIKKRGLYGSK
jgi:nicotinate-nucleotide adenylyltransferase